MKTKDTGINLEPQLLKAMLAGKKTQLRRVVHPQPKPDPTGRWSWVASSTDRSLENKFTWSVVDEQGSSYTVRGKERPTYYASPLGVWDDRLWLKERYYLSQGGYWRYMDEVAPDSACAKSAKEGKGWKIVPASHMPRKHARKFYKITSLQVQRLHDITEEEAIAEGIEKEMIEERGKPAWELGWKNYLWHGHLVPRKLVDGWENQYSTSPSARDCFASFWELTHGSGSWARNPWVWVVSFEELKLPGNTK